MKRIVEQGIADLPEPGDARRDVLKERGDALEERAEVQSVDRGRIDPSKLRVENELAQHFNELEVSNQDLAYVYKWVQAGFYGRFIKAELSKRWEVVQGDAQEAIELKGMGADTTRRLGDVILMRCRKDIYKRLMRQEDAHRRAVESGVTSEIEELGRKYEKYGLIVHAGEGLSSTLLKRMQTSAAAKQVVGKQVDQLLRDGRMPGAPAPRR